MKTKRYHGEDSNTKYVIPMGGRITLTTTKIILNKCLQDRNNVNAILMHKKEDKYY